MLLQILLLSLFVCLNAKLVTIRNDVLRYDTNGNVVDCHSGNLVKIGSEYFLYGERYGNSTGFNDREVPKLHVYSTTDFKVWLDRGPMIANPPSGSYFTPMVIYNAKTQTYVVWFNYYPNGCCGGDWGVAQSKTGTNFQIVTLHEKGRYPNVDCNGLFVDDDGTAYVAYSSIDMDHMSSIEKLTPDYLHSTKENYGLFPDHYVEGSALWKRNGIYYAAYGSCCCFCRPGSGVVVYSAKNITGPWTRQSTDVNCDTKNNPVCGKYGARITSDSLIIDAQIITVSTLKASDGSSVYLWAGERWLSAPNNNPTCPDECRPETGICQEPPTYVKGHGYAYWYSLEFGANGEVKTFQPFVNSFQLDLAF